MHQICFSLLPGDLVFDVGANLGDKTAAYLSRGARVIAIEPQFAMIAQLQDRFGKRGDVTVLEVGLSDAVGELQMSVNSAVPAISTFMEEWKFGRFSGQKWDQVATVPVTTLDILIKEYGSPRFIKIDVEGFEETVVKGLTKRSGCISIEYTAEFIHKTENVIKSLSDLGYTNFNFSKGDNDFFELESWISADAIVHHLRSYSVEYDLAFGDVYAT